MNQKEIDELWFSFQPIPGAAYRLNDSVGVTSGEFKGESGAVVSLLALAPEPVYLVELSSGADIKISESELERAG
jgi:hypothetical protein